MEKKDFELLTKERIAMLMMQSMDDLECCGNCANCYLESEFCIKCKLNPGGMTPHNKYCDNWRYDNLTQQERRNK